MVKSSLATVVVDFGTKKSNARTEKISKITIHHTASQTKADSCARGHRDTSREASANYYIGYDGVICAGVSEDRRAWTSSSGWNDQRAITIEVSNNSGAPNWTVSNASYKSLIKLCADICKRYNINPHWDGTKNGSLTVHRQFVATACPGPYLYNKITSGQVERDIKAAMGSKPEPETKKLYRVQVGAFKKKGNADNLAKKLKEKGYDVIVKQVGAYYKVQCGAFSVKKNAQGVYDKLVKDGYKPFIVEG